MRFLIITTKYPVREGDSWMSSDLADQLRARGHDIDVVLIDWDATPGEPTRRWTSKTGVDVLRVTPRAIMGWGTLVYRITKMAASGPVASRAAWAAFAQRDYDAMVAFTPASAEGSVIKRFAHIPARMLFIFDFYPIMQREIGMVPPGPIYAVAMRGERRLMRRFTTLICNLPGNIPYLRRHYRPDALQRITSHPLWSDTTPVMVRAKAAIRAKHGLPLDRPIAVFGGQITDGRGVELMLDAARNSAKRNSPLFYLFIGEGRLTEEVDAQCADLGNAKRLSGMSRDQYLEAASACDVGMVATVPGVSSFNFPTKTIDYLRVDLPVVAAVEPESDYVDILTNYAVGLGVDFRDASAYAAALEGLAGDAALRAAMPERARRCLDEVFDASRAADKVLSEVAATGGKN